MDFYYYLCKTPDDTAVIKTDKNPAANPLTTRQAADIMKKLYNSTNVNPDQMTVTAIDHSRAIRITGSIDEMTIPIQLPDGTTYYQYPGHTVPITMTRWDRNGTQGCLTDVIHVPAVLVNKDCTGAAVKALFRMAMRDYLDQYPDSNGPAVIACPELPNWNNFVNLPDSLLARYGIRIEPLDTYLSLEVGMDEPIFD